MMIRYIADRCFCIQRSFIQRIEKWRRKTESDSARGRGRIVDQVKINVELKCIVMKRTLFKSRRYYLALPPYVFAVSPRPLVDYVLSDNAWRRMDDESIQQFLHLARNDRLGRRAEELDSPKQSTDGDESLSEQRRRSHRFFFFDDVDTLLIRLT